MPTGLPNRQRPRHRVNPPAPVAAVAPVATPAAADGNYDGDAVLTIMHLRQHEE